MLFERTIRRKKIPSHYLEIIGGLFIYESLLVLLLMLFTIRMRPYLGREGIGQLWVIFLVVAFLLFTVAVIGDMFPAFYVGFNLFRDRKKKRIITKDLTVFNYDYWPASFLRYGEACYTYAHFFFMEPCIRAILFNGVPNERKIDELAPLRFYLPEVHYTYRFHDDYKTMKEEYKAIKDEAEDYVYRKRPYEDTLLDKKSPDFMLYMTYEKIEILNKLFSLVNPPEFRMTTYEKSSVFISIEPIPGKEYPPKALECMEKVNAMYP